MSSRMVGLGYSPDENVSEARATVREMERREAYARKCPNADRLIRCLEQIAYDPRTEEAELYKELFLHALQDWLDGLHRKRMFGEDVTEDEARVLWPLVMAWEARTR